MSVDVIKSAVTAGGGLARPNNFHIELPSLPGANSALLNTLCRTASMPAKQISTLERSIGMKTEKIAYGYVTDDVNLSFLLTNDYSVKEYFDFWKSLIIDEDSHTAGYKNNYQKPVKIHQLANTVPQISAALNVVAGPISANFSKSIGFPLNGRINVVRTVYSVELIDAFPLSVSAVEFNNEADAFLELSVQMAYTTWRRIESSQPTWSLSI